MCFVSGDCDALGRLPKSRFCITEKYMVASAVITVRIDPDLLTALKAKALEEGRTVSAEVVHLVRREVGPAPRRATSKARSTMGMFPDFEAPDLDEMIVLRRRASGTLERRRKRA